MGTHSKNSAGITLIVLSILIPALLAICASGVQAALIQGDVYTFDLEHATGVIVEANTIPHQQVVVRNGTYALNVPSGSYTLTAIQRQKSAIIAQTTENITVAAEGTYTVDLILFPVFNDTQYNIDVEVPPAAVDDTTPAASAQTGRSDTSTMLVIGVAAIIMVIAGIIIVLLRKRRRAAASAKPSAGSTANPAQSDTQALIDALRKNNGRLTQKDLRRMFPHSEAKVSLMLTELEHKGVIEKIRKGRSNVIILK